MSEVNLTNSLQDVIKRITDFEDKVEEMGS